MSKIVRMMEYRRRPDAVYFNRSELGQLLTLYSRRVARGEWRDYGISHEADMARFFIYRHANEKPLFTIVKHPDPAHPHAQSSRKGPKGQYAVFEGIKKVCQGASLLETLELFSQKANLKPQ